MRTLLKGLKVVEIGQGVAAPFCGLMLADMGAEVIKIEPPPRGDLSREWGPPFIGGESAYFLSLNRNKKSIVIDLKDRRGREIVRRLCKDADVVIENFRPGVMKRLGVGYHQIKKINPDVVYCSITGYGQRGPSKDNAAFDLVIQAQSGLMDITGERGPVKIGIPIVDIGAGMYAAFAIALSLNKRTPSKSTWLDISLLDTAASWLSYWVTGHSFFLNSRKRWGTAHPTIVPYQLFEAKDGFIAIAASTDGLWRRMCEALGAKELLSDARFRTNSERVKNRDDLVGLLNSRLRLQERQTLFDALSKAGVPSAPLKTIEEIISDQQIAYRRMIGKLSHPTAGGILAPGSPLKFLPASGARPDRAPPLLGEHAEEILDSLDYGRDDINRLLEAGVLGVARTKEE